MRSRRDRISQVLEGNLVELGGLFGAAFLAATLLPAQSEALLAAMVIGAIASVPVLLAVAAIGNILGSCVNWWLGLQVDRFRGRRWFPVSENALAKALGVSSRQVVDRWETYGIPLKYAGKLKALTGMPASAIWPEKAALFRE